MKRSSLPLGPGGDIAIAVISDTHSHPHERSAELVAAQEPTAILHGGDIGDESALEPFAAIAPLVAVRGNIDERAPHLPDDVVIALKADGTSVLKILLTHIAVNGPRIRPSVAERAKSYGASLIVCGHSHVPFIGRDRGLSVFNAGSIGPRRFHLPIVFGMLRLTGGRLRMQHIDCETGEAWLP